MHCLPIYRCACLAGRIASLIGAMYIREFVTELIAMPSLIPGPLHACMVKSGPKKANIGVFKTI